MPPRQARESESPRVREFSMLLFPEAIQRMNQLGRAIQQCCTLYKNSEVMGVCSTIAVRTAVHAGCTKEKYLEILGIMFDDETKRAADRKAVKVNNGETTSPGQHLVRPS